MNNLDYPPVQGKRRNKILAKNRMEIKPSTKGDFQEGNTRTNPPRAKTLTLQDQK